MKKIILVIVALCFVFAGSYEAVSQNRKVVKKSAKRKLVKCRVNGKIVYRANCPTLTIVPNVSRTPTTTQTSDETYGLILSDGQGTGGGRGTGRGTGQGSGLGYGTGSGNGNTEQDQTVDPQLPVKPRGVNENLRILSKPRAIYTDAARTNLVQGTVNLRVTFLANGKIGNVAPINGLGYGLTEQAVNAAKAIRFEPAIRNGKPYTVSKIISYSFTLY